MSVAISRSVRGVAPGIQKRNETLSADEERDVANARGYSRLIATHRGPA
jgi:hypothetical protein